VHACVCAYVWRPLYLRVPMYASVRTGLCSGLVVNLTYPPPARPCPPVCVCVCVCVGVGVLQCCPTAASGQTCSATSASSWWTRRTCTGPYIHTYVGRYIGR
jgi:hypothetical protein